MSPIALRCSALPTFMRCFQSAVGDVRIKEFHAEAVLGQAVHAALARYVAGMPVEVAAVAALYGADEDELGYLFRQGCIAWDEIRPRVADSPVWPEWRLQAVVAPSVDLTGAADVIIEHDGGRVLEVIDWKTGRRDADHREQVLGYCLLGLENFPKAEAATSRVVWLRDLSAEIYSMRRSEMDMYKERLRVQLGNEAYQPGEHCGYCPRKFQCEGRIEMSRAALAVIGGQRVDLATMTPDQQVALYRKAREVVDLGFRVIDQVKALAREEPIKGMGVRLEVVQDSRRALKAAEAWPVLQKHLSDEALAEAVKVSITAVQEAVARDAPRGEGAGRKRAILAELEEAGAVTTTTVERLSERRL
jgi:hypothetical protein